MTDEVSTTRKPVPPRRTQTAEELTGRARSLANLKIRQKGDPKVPGSGRKKKQQEPVALLGDAIELIAKQYGVAQAENTGAAIVAQLIKRHPEATARELFNRLVPRVPLAPLLIEDLDLDDLPAAIAHVVDLMRQGRDIASLKALLDALTSLQQARVAEMQIATARALLEGEEDGED